MKDDYNSAYFQNYGRRRHGKPGHLNTGVTIDFPTEYDFPPYDNCGAKYDVESGTDGGSLCTDKIDVDRPVS